MVGYSPIGCKGKDAGDVAWIQCRMARQVIAQHQANGRRCCGRAVMLGSDPIQMECRRHDTSLPEDTFRIAVDVVPLLLLLSLTKGDVDRNVVLGVSSLRDSELYIDRDPA